MARELEVRLIDTICISSYDHQSQGGLSLLKPPSIAGEGTLLPGGHAPLPEHVTADRALHAALLREGAILPSVGEEGAAL